MSGKPVDVDFLDSYDASWLVHRCVKVISQNVANANLHLYKLRREKVIEVDNHPVLDLLDKPNPLMTGFEFLEMTQTCLELFGNAYWYKVRGERTAKIQQLQILRPDWIEIKLAQDGSISSYEYRMGAQVENISPENIIHFKETNPRSSLYGLSTVKPALDIVSNLVFSTRWNKNFFKNNARPDYWIISKSRINKEEKEELKKKMYDDYGGVKNAHKFGILEGEAEIKEMTGTMRDMEFNKLTESMIIQILGAFGIGKAIIGMQGMNRAEAEAQIYAFMSQSIEPRIKKLVNRINEFLLPEYGDGLYFDYDDPTPDDRKATIEEYESALRSGWMLVNEVRDREGLPPIEGGWGDGNSDKYYALKEEKKQKELKKKILTGALKSKIKIKNQLLESYVNFRKLIKKLEMTPEQKQAFWKEHDNLLVQDEKLFKTFVVKLFKDQEERIKEAVRINFTKDASDIIGWQEERDLFFNLSVPVYTDIVGRRGERAGKLIGITFRVDQTVMNFIDDKAFQFADQVNATTQNHLREALKEGIEQGEGVPDLTKRVSEVFKERTTWESERIARTEVIEASNKADLMAYQQSNVVTHKEWLAEMDDRTSEICQNLNGEVVLLNENFSDGSDAPPAHVNCRSTILPIIKEF